MSDQDWEGGSRSCFYAVIINIHNAFNFVKQFITRAIYGSINIHNAFNFETVYLKTSIYGSADGRVVGHVRV